jgi:hypothetical protein
MGLTKTQINYLEDKLDRAVNDKVDKFKKQLGEGKSSDRVLVDEIVAGNIQILSQKELIKKLKEKTSNNSYYYNTNLYVTEIVADEDRERIEQEVRERDNKINDYRDKLYTAKQNALDSIVLNGVDVETALAELDKIQ